MHCTSLHLSQWRHLWWLTNRYLLNENDFSPFFTERNSIALSARLEVHVGLVCHPAVGQPVQNRNTQILRTNLLPVLSRKPHDCSSMFWLVPKMMVPKWEISLQAQRRSALLAAFNLILYDFESPIRRRHFIVDVRNNLCQMRLTCRQRTKVAKVCACGKERLECLSPAAARTNQWGPYITRRSARWDQSTQPPMKIAQVNIHHCPPLISNLPSMSWWSLWSGNGDKTDVDPGFLLGKWKVNIPHLHANTCYQAETNPQSSLDPPQKQRPWPLAILTVSDDGEISAVDLLLVCVLILLDASDEMCNTFWEQHL